MRAGGNTPGPTTLWALGTAVPRYRIAQEEALRFMLACCRADARLERQLRYVYRRSQIAFRHTCCADFAAGPRTEALFLEGDPGTAQRMRRYEREVVPLAEAAARRALEAQGIFSARQVTHLILVSCTGFFAPGPEVELVERLALRPQVHRLQIGFMGCQAALQGLRAASAFCRGEPDAVVLLVCAELCTLHFQRRPSAENLVVNSLFGDGAAAAVLSAPTAGGAGLCTLEYFASHLEEKSRSVVSWRIGDQGFQMGLDLAAPEALRRALPGFVERLLAAGQWGREEIEAWAVHPGGRAILDALEGGLGLDGRALKPARWVLRQCGNMSSPTVLFVLERVLRQAPAAGVLLSFGPGLSLEGALWRRGGSHG